MKGFAIFLAEQKKSAKQKSEFSLLSIFLRHSFLPCLPFFGPIVLRQRYPNNIRFNSQLKGRAVSGLSTAGSGRAWAWVLI
jgi:hypothetical protein